MLLLNALKLKGGLKMSVRAKLKIESVGMLSVSVFYLVVGALCFFVLATNFRLIHIGIIGVFSLITSYGVFKKRFWAMWSAIILLFMATVFSATILYFFFGKDLVLDLGSVVYLVLTWIFTAYLAAKRKNLS
ncbi:hypothetical protein C0195_00555 [Candidatus Bathyarchaeota archaeon]|nr:MAG: hypothetical protein C0195_00555 [Candidatus Bathyarchaeota archaeon]